MAVKETSDKFGLKLCWVLQAAARTQGENEANTSRNKHISSRLLRIVFSEEAGGHVLLKVDLFCKAVWWRNKATKCVIEVVLQ